MSKYLPYLKGTDKETMEIKDVLTHQARLTDWIPFQNIITKSDSLRNYYLAATEDSEHTFWVANSLYCRKSFGDTIRKRIADSKLLKTKDYKYSDLGFYMFRDVIEEEAGEPMEDFLAREFYRPMGAVTMGYRPLERYRKLDIAPTEYDGTFRKQLVWGTVHDQGAALLGGVSGHAGLFSNANDLAKLGQMLLWKGKYGGYVYLKSETVDLWTSCQFCPGNRRGLAFDKPEPDKNSPSPVSRYVSQKAFGHQGFTGTCIWIDPEEEIVYVFLSNRIHPNAENGKINKLGVRNKILDILYQAIGYK
jgi:CubicO group peptidase (beta-lactamase class C family)